MVCLLVPPHLMWADLLCLRAVRVTVQTCLPRSWVVHQQSFHRAAIASLTSVWVFCPFGLFYRKSKAPRFVSQSSPFLLASKLPLIWQQFFPAGRLSWPVEENISSWAKSEHTCQGQEAQWHSSRHSDHTKQHLGTWHQHSKPLRGSCFLHHILLAHTATLLCLGLTYVYWGLL